MSEDERPGVRNTEEPADDVEAHRTGIRKPDVRATEEDDDVEAHRTGIRKPSAD